MAKTRKINDINYRFNMAVAERNCHEKGSKHYSELSEVIAFILDEYKQADMRKPGVRHSFRMDGNGYRMVTLDAWEAC